MSEQEEAIVDDEMDDLDRYIEGRKTWDPEFEKEWNKDWSDFILSSELVSLREFLKMTQEDVAKKMHTTKSAVSRWENHAEDIRLSTLKKLAKVFGKKLKIEFV